jgi:hypothetical protein
MPCGSEATRMENEHADAVNDDGGHHHLEQCVIAKAQLRDDGIGVGEAGALKEPAEDEAE